jgi:hypothetical protein
MQTGPSTVPGYRLIASKTLQAGVLPVCIPLSVCPFRLSVQVTAVSCCPFAFVRCLSVCPYSAQSRTCGH